jgi:hypothetical protein
VDHQIVHALMHQQLLTLRRCSYHDLILRMGHPETVPATGEDGKTYQLEVQVFWDSKKGGDIRVIVSGDDSTFPSVMFPLADSFTMAPDGSIVGD